MRDAGYVDPELREILRARGEGDLEPDYDPQPTPYQSAYALLEYEKLAALMNDKGADGRTDWTTEEAWSLSRAAWAEEHGFDPEETRGIALWRGDPELRR